MVRIFCLEYRLDATVAAHKLAKVNSIICEPSLTVWATYHITLILMSSEFALPDATFAAFPTVLLSALLLQVLKEFFLQDIAFPALPAPFYFTLKLMLRKVPLQERLPTTRAHFPATFVKIANQYSARTFAAHLEFAPSDMLIKPFYLNGFRASGTPRRLRTETVVCCTTHRV
jgi:hypothetical protein